MAAPFFQEVVAVATLLAGDGNWDDRHVGAAGEGSEIVRPPVWKRLRSRRPIIFIHLIGEAEDFARDALDRRWSRFSFSPRRFCADDDYLKGLFRFWCGPYVDFPTGQRQILLRVENDAGDRSSRPFRSWTCCGSLGAAKTGMNRDSGDDYLSRQIPMMGLLAHSSER